tara:strand:+ start:56 stop:415 length:360 start_codon:yes stop_codon:yes gene_type:complete
MNRKDQIVAATNKIQKLLLEKNDAYGDSALSPLNIFSSANAEYGIRQRIDDKLKRVQNAGLNDDTEDTLLDLAGYLILLIIARDEGDNIQNNIQEGSAASNQYRHSSASHKGWSVEGDG